MRLVLPLLLIGCGASAECPTAADLAQGIRLHWSNGTVTTIRTTDDPVIMQVRTNWSGGAHVVERVAWGLYSLEETEVEGTDFDVPAGKDYGVDPQHLPRPTAESVVRFAEVLYDYHWDSFWQETYHMGSPGTVMLAGCAYRAFEVTLASAVIPFDGPVSTPQIVKGWAYLVDLGFAVESWVGPPENRYPAPDVVAIEAVR